MLFLHIGRSKSGSTTIQEFCRRNPEFLRDHGVVCPLMSARSGNSVALVETLVGLRHDDAEIAKLIDALKENHQNHVLVSSEYFFGIPRDHIKRLHRELGQYPVTILCYVRDYPSWLVSSYSQAVKKGREVVDFDHFYQRMVGTASAIAPLRGWADVFGWHRVRVRTLHKDTLHGQHLIPDLLHALGISARAPEMEDSNVSPRWWTLEFARAFYAANPPRTIGEAQRKSVRGFLKLFEACGGNLEDDAQYLTKEQWRRAADSYNADMAALGQETGMTFKVLEEEPDERPFLPALDRVGEAVRREFMRQITRSWQRRHVTDEAYDMLRRVPELSVSEMSDA